MMKLTNYQVLFLTLKKRSILCKVNFSQGFLSIYPEFKLSPKIWGKLEKGSFSGF